MTTEEWDRIKVLLAEALDRPPAERQAFLEAACRHDAHLHAEVASLLEAYASADAADALESPFADAHRTIPSLAGRRLGPYRLLHVIGQGGMGAVYVAERADGQFDQRVAVKLVPPHLATPELLRRFRSERQILAHLDHPHIARLYDGGVTDEGIPYLVMEYVEGIPVTAYCERHHLSTDQRLRLFRTICDAVAYAHRNLVVHRDLKPSNILVRDDGQVKLLDFGIAKLLNEDEAAARTELRAMTPEYAAPEQILGGTVTTTTDVYQLGVLLYELLTGRRPYDLRERSPREAERVICYQEPERPSEAILASPQAGRHPRAEQEKLRQRLAGDLDTIVLKALQKEPDRRYGSVELLRDDLWRHEHNLPVLARKDTFGYRASRFVRRHRLAVGAASTVLVLLVAVVALAVHFALTTAAQSEAIRTERDRARTEAAKAEQINIFLQRVLSAADPFQEGRDVRVVDVLEGAAARIETELAGQPDVAAAVYRTLGITYQNLGLYAEAESILNAVLAAVQDEDPSLATTALGYLADLREARGDAPQAAAQQTRTDSTRSR